MKLDQILDKIDVLPKSSKQELKKHITEVHYPKGHILLKAEKVEKNIYFIKHGIVRAYSAFSDEEITFWFGKEGDTVISMKSYVANQKGYENIELLEDCELYKLETAKLQKLFSRDVSIANWGRKFAEQELIKTEQRLISRLFYPAKDRYAELLKENPHLLQRVKLGIVASYLGITQVSLSRIRAKIR